MKKLFEVLRQNGYKQTSLSVQKNSPAVRFYQRLGYGIITERSDNAGHTDYIMLKKLKGEIKMSTDCLSVFCDKAIIPDDNMVAAALGDAAALWDELRAHVTVTYPNITDEWKHYSKAAGWSYKLLSKKRNLLFFVPMTGAFRLRIVLGEKGCGRVESDSELPEDIKEAFRAVTPYTEGRSVDVDITRRGQIETIKRLLEIKVEN